ncbi:MAG: hypothetical protein KBF88_12675 [Polyangiaceae bacterium]|nr:hypothetical protein [Polyangiaceae bacterium]
MSDEDVKREAPSLGTPGAEFGARRETIDPAREQAAIDPPGQIAPLAANPSEASSKAKGVATIGAGILLFLAKFKSIFVVLKALPFFKIFLTSFSMFAMMWFEAVRYGWIFGVGFVLLILVHELGHGYYIKKNGIDAGWPIFIPGIGALIAQKGRSQSRDVDAEISYGGPFVGGAASAAVAGVYFLTRNPFWLALAQTGFMLNLFNLMPVRPLDGGAIAEVFSPRAWILGVIGVALLFYVTHSPVLIMIGMMALPRLFNRTSPDEIEPVSEEVRAKWQARYFGLVTFLALGFFFARRILFPPMD